MNWGGPGWLLLLLGVAAVAVVVAAGAWRHQVLLRRVFGEGVLEQVVPWSVRRRRRLRDVAALGALALMVVALAEPRFDKQIRTVTARGADILLLVDLSRSMDAQDVDPSRLERARREVADLGRMLQGDRVGLVIYSGGAYLRLPLTEDFVALENVLAAADTRTFEANGSALGVAIDTALEALSRSEGQAGQALLVLSDGEIHDRDAALAAARQAAERGIPIYAMGIGVEAASIPLPNGGYLRHEGKLVQTAPDFTVLEEVARLTGGAFVQSVASSRDMEGLYQGSIRRSLMTVERSSRQRETWRAAFQWPLGLAVLLWLGGAWLGDGRKRRFGMAGAALLAVGLAAPPAHAMSLEEVDALYRAGRFPQAAEELTKLSLERPDDADVFDRLGAARYRAGDYDGAARAWDQASDLSGGDPTADFNAGNAYFRSGRLEEAAERFDRAQEADPDFEPAKTNRELVDAALAARRQQQPPPPPEGGEDEEQEGDPQDGEGEQQNPESGQGEGEQPEQGQGEGDDEQDPTDSPEDGGEQEGDDSQPSDAEGSQGGSSGDQEPDEGEGSEAVSPDDLEPSDEQGEGTPQGEGGAGADGEPQGPITAGQAERLLDAVEEGSQRIYVRGKGEDKPW